MALGRGRHHDVMMKMPVYVRPMPPQRLDMDWDMCKQQPINHPRGVHLLELLIVPASRECVVVPQDDPLVSVQSRHDPSDPTTCVLSPHGHVAQVVAVILWTHNFVPILDQRLIHLLVRVEGTCWRPIRQYEGLPDVGVVEVRIRRDPDSVCHCCMSNCVDGLGTHITYECTHLAYILPPQLRLRGQHDRRTCTLRLQLLDDLCPFTHAVFSCIRWRSPASLTLPHIPPCRQF